MDNGLSGAVTSFPNDDLDARKTEKDAKPYYREVGVL